MSEIKEYLIFDFLEIITIIMYHTSTCQDCNLPMPCIKIY